MPIVASQVVGLIELDEQRQSASDHALRPLAASARRGYATAARWQQSRPTVHVETVSADLDQLNDDLHVELASIVSRIARVRRS